jgi:hypothetical protein
MCERTWHSVERNDRLPFSVAEGQVRAEPKELDVIVISGNMAVYASGE